MTKKQIILISVSAIISLFILSLGIVLMKRQREKEVYFATPTIKKIYCFHPKTFPAPYEKVGGLPSF